MEPSYKILKQAIHKAGAKTVAAELGLSLSLIYKWCQDRGTDVTYPLPSGTQNPLDRLKKIYELTGDDDLIHWVCRMGQGYFVRNTAGQHPSCDAHVLRNIQNFIKEFSETLDAIARSYNNDKRISLDEAKAIRKEWEQLKRIGEGFVRACEDGRFAAEDAEN